MKKRSDPDAAGQDDFERQMAGVKRLSERERLVEETVVREGTGAPGMGGRAHSTYC